MPSACSDRIAHANWPTCLCPCRRPPGQFAGRLVAIDARVQRRPPRALVKEEDAAVEQAAELVLNDSQVFVGASSKCDSICQLRYHLPSLLGRSPSLVTAV